jgi:anthranilate phosphoribosyltransferase
MYAYLYQDTNTNFTSSFLDGYDEYLYSAPLKIIIPKWRVCLTLKNFVKLLQVDIEGGTTIEESAQLFTTIISGKGTEAQNNVVCANAGMVIATVNGCSPIRF